MYVKLDVIDRTIGLWLKKYGHLIHRLGLGTIFVWFGLLKPFGHDTTTSLLAHTIYVSSPEVMVPLLGWWEAAIGACLLVRPLNRIALALLAIRLPGTVLAFFVLPEVCFDGSVLIPTPEGQYLVKDLVLFTAAMIIGGTVRRERVTRVLH
ncbi:MAG: DoxX family protein [Planctomycetota bacterium]|nr:DoxX family protein [Planctomycetota bacterium]